MKTFFATLFAVTSLAVWAGFVEGAPFSQDSKHGQLRASEVPVPVDLAKFVWLETDVASRAVNYIVVSIPDQRLYAYNGIQLVAWSNVSSGRPGFETPTGTYQVSEKDPDHHSSLFENAPMPFFMRLTDGGVGLHGGFLPGYPASHGCVRLPLEMAKELFQLVAPGTTVDVLDTSVVSDVNKLKASSTGAKLADD